MTTLALPRTAAPVPSIMDGRVDWRTEAIAAYRRMEQEELRTPPALLAARIRDLTGHAVGPRSIHVERAAHTATVSVDGVIFRLRQRTLTLIRPCATAPSGYVESAPIMHRSDVGRVLLAWDAADDATKDDDDWSHSW